MSKGKILFQLSGSIACFKACQLLSKLVQDGYEVEVVATRSALAFVGEATLEGLTGRKIHTEAFASGEYMNHIHLIRWADIVLLCPATANVISKMASGIADDLLTTLFLAHDFKKPYLIAPAMNTAMMKHPATQSSIKMLREWGIEVLESGSGSLACGEVGEGRLLETEQIHHIVNEKMASVDRTVSAKSSSPRVNLASELRNLPQAPKSLRVLVTSGGTREPIDGVRSITNFSTGRTGVSIAEYLASRGHRVTLVRAKDSAAPAWQDEFLRDTSFITFEELRRKLRSELSSGAYDVVIHAAAVSDFSIAGLETEGQKITKFGEGKIDSSSELVLRLSKNPKIVTELREMAHEPALKVVAFKLTNSRDESVREQAVHKLANSSAPDFIVHNDLQDIDPSGDRHPARIFSFSGSKLNEIARVQSKSALAEVLETILLETV